MPEAQPTTAYNPSTGEQLNLVGGAWIPAAKAAAPAREKPLTANSASNSLALMGWSAPKVAYNEKTKKMLQLNPATNQWEPASKYAMVRADMQKHPLRYANPVAAVGGLTETTAQAFVGLAGQMNSIVAGAAAKPGEYHKAKEAYSKAWNKLYDVKPETHWGWAINQAFSFISEGLNKEQQVVQKATGSEAAGDVASLFTGILLMDVNEAGSHVKSVWGKVVNGKKPVQEGFDKFAAADPESAEKVAEKMSDTDIKREMKERIAAVTMTKDALKEKLDPKNYQVKKAATAKPKSTDSVEVTQEGLDKMFNPDEIARAQKEHEVATAHELKGKFDSMKKGFEEQTAWRMQEAQKSHLSQTVAKTAIPEGPWTELASGKVLAPEHATAMSNAFEASLFGKSGMHSALSPLTKEVWDDLTKKILPATNSDNQLIYPTKDGIVNFWNNWVGKGFNPVMDKQGRPQTFYNAMYNADEPLMAGRVTFASSDPLVSGSYIGDPRVYGREPLPIIDEPMPKGQISKMYAAFKNPLVVDAAGSGYHSVPFEGKIRPTDIIVKEARARGHDGVVFNNIVDDVGGEAKYHPSTVVAAIIPGRLKSATGNSGAFEHPYDWMHQVIGPVDKDLIGKVLDAAPGAGLGAHDNPTVKQALVGSQYTLKTLERLPEKPMLMKAQVTEQMARADVTQAEKDVLNSVLDSFPGENISAKDLVKGFQVATDGFALKPKDTEQYADYGLENISRPDIGYDNHAMPGSAKSTIWQLPITLSDQNHFGDPHYFAHTREFEEKSVPHVVEVQSDVAQHAKTLTEPERMQIQLELNRGKEDYNRYLNANPSESKYNHLKDPQYYIQQMRAAASTRVHELEAKLNSGQAGSALAPLMKHWYRRIIGEVLARASREGKERVRFATADTVAKVEGWPRNGFLGKEGKLVSPSHQSIYDRYNTEIASHLRRLGGHNYTDPQGHTWIEVPTAKFTDKRIDMFGTNMLYSVLGPFDPKVIKDALKLLKTIPGYQVAEEKSRIVAREMLSTFYPEGLSDKAEQAAAVLAHGIAVESHLKSIVQFNDKAQDAYWEGKPKDYQLNWLMDWEAGKTPKIPAEAKMLEQYKERMRIANESDVMNGVKEYTPIDNYVYHLFENGPAVDDFLTKKYGVKWGDPRFTKARGFRYIKDAVDAGFRLRTTKPDAVVEAREFASLVAGIRVHMLEELTKGGMAVRKVGDMTMPHGMIPRRSPSGQMYYLHPDVAHVVHNAFDSRSLWSDPGVRGMAYRNWMYLKNHTVPVILSFSAFHPLHIGLGMDFASEMTRISQELASGVTSAADSIPRAAKALAIIPGQVERSQKGFRMLRVLTGEEKNPTPEETTSLNYMLRGGFIPFNTSEFNTGALKQLRGAIKRNAYVTAGWKLPWAMLEAIGWPIYQKWIPAIKTANYLEDVASAIKSDPELLKDDAKMNVRLNKIRKSAEDRFGQMSYNTLFWNRWARDIGQATTLSMGWKLGFVRQFLGQPFEAAKAVEKLAKGTSAKELITKGELNKTMFVGYYVMMAAGLGGLMTYMMTGTPPQGQDYILPRVGGTNPDGSPRRVNTMFYTREYASFWNHVQNEGLGAGLTQYAVNSAAPNFKMAHEFYTGLDYRNHEIYDPDAPEWKQIVQKTAAVLGDLDPISVETYKRTGDAKGTTLGILGFTPAPKYMTESPTEGKIKRMAGYYNQHITPFEKAQYSEEVVALHNAARTGDEAGYQKAVEDLSSKYHLSSDEMNKLQKGSHTDPMIAMFKHLTTKQQVRLLKDMTPEEKQKYARAAHNDAKRQLMEEGGE